MYENNNSTKINSNKETKTKQGAKPFRKPSTKAHNSSGRVVKGKAMFNSDIDARKNAIEKDKLEETKRHNKSVEAYDRANKIMTGIGSMARGLNPFKFSGRIGNHPSWYLQDTSLAGQTTAISDKVPIGKNQEVIEIYRDANTKYSFGPQEAVFIAYDYAPIVSLYDGKVSNNIDELNAAIFDKAPNYISKALYTAVKSACRRNLPYSPSDVIRTILVVMDIFCNIEVIKRVYRIANTYQFTNQVVGAQLVECLGFDFNQVRDHLSDILFRVNRLGKMLATVHIPKGQTLLDRWLLLAGAVFKDRDCSRTRLFGFRKRIMYLNVQGEVEGQVPRMLVAKTMENQSGELVYRGSSETIEWQGWDYNKVLTAIEAQIYSLLNNADILSCLADINTAFESNGFWDFVPLQADEQQDFAYDEIMISQVRNSILCGYPRNILEEDSSTLDAQNFDVYDVGNGNILQGPGYQGYVYPVMFPTVFAPISTSTAMSDWEIQGSFTPRIGIDTPVDNPDAGILLTVSRLSPTLEDAVYYRTSSGNDTYLVRTCSSHGSEILLGAEVLLQNKYAKNQSYDYMYLRSNLGNQNSLNAITRQWSMVQAYNAIPRALGIEMVSNVISTSGGKLVVRIITNVDPIVIGDMTHVVYCDNSLISRWHFIAIASEYAIPNVVKV